MNKELDALEILEQLKNFVLEFIKNGLDRRFIHGSFDAIKKELKDYQEIKEIAKRYNWDDITSKIFNVEADKKYRDLFNSAIVNIQEDYRKARALEIIRNIGILKPYETIGGQCWLETISDATKITKENYDLLKEVLL